MVSFVMDLIYVEDITLVTFKLGRNGYYVRFSREKKKHENPDC